QAAGGSADPVYESPASGPPPSAGRSAADPGSARVFAIPGRQLGSRDEVSPVPGEAATPLSRRSTVRTSRAARTTATSVTTHAAGLVRRRGSKASTANATAAVVDTPRARPLPSPSPRRRDPPRSRTVSGRPPSSGSPGL